MNRQNSLSTLVTQLSGARAAVRFGALAVVAAVVTTTNSLPAIAADGVFSSTPLSTSEAGAGIKLRVTAVPNGCTWGDFDAVRSDLLGSESPSLLLSLEPLSGGTAQSKNQSRDLTKFDLTKGFITNFNVAAASPGHYALYLCKDSAKKGQCGDKPLVPPQEVLSFHMSEIDRTTGKTVKEAASGEPTDKVYYFAYLFVDKGSVYVLKSPMDSADFVAAGKFLGSRGVAASVIKTVEQKHRPMNSIQPKVVDGTLTVSLPQVDQASCPKG